MKIFKTIKDFFAELFGCNEPKTKCELGTCKCKSNTTNKPKKKKKVQEPLAEPTVPCNSITDSVCPNSGEEVVVKKAKKRKPKVKTDNQ